MSLSRQLIVGINPQTNAVSTFSFPFIPDGNYEDKVFTCAHVPLTRGTSTNNLQEGVMLGTSGLDADLFAFREDYTTDDGQTIRAEAISQRIDPTIEVDRFSDTKMFVGLDFPSIDPLAQGLTLQYCINSDAPHKDSVTWEDFVYTSDEGRVFFEDANGRWAHLRIVDETMQVSTEVFSSFNLNYYNLFLRRKYGST